MFDTRSDMKTPAVLTETGKVDLFTHARYTDHHVLLGYGDGEMKQLDMRKPGKMSVDIPTHRHMHPCLPQCVIHRTESCW